MIEKTKKIKVLRIINRFNIGGPTYNATFLTAFLGNKYETKLVGGLPEEGETDSLYIPQKYGVNPILIPELKREPNVRSDREAYRKIKQIIKEFKPDIVHTHASKAGALGRRAAASCDVPIIVHTFHGHVFHSYFGRFKTEVFRRIEKSLAKRSTGIVAISDIQKQELTEEHKVCKKKKVKVINLGFDLEQFQEKRKIHREEVRKEYNLQSDDVAVAIIGRLAPIKNHDFFLKAIKKVLKKTTKSVKVFIVGDGDERENIDQIVNELNSRFGNRIKMTSWIKDVGRFNAGMDIICLSSDNEGTPVSLIEAQAANIPVVTTDVGGVRDIVLQHETGFIVPVGELNMYANAILELVENDKTRIEMSQNGWKFVQKKFSYHTLVKNMDNYYTKLMKKVN